MWCDLMPHAVVIRIAGTFTLILKLRCLIKGKNVGIM